MTKDEQIASATAAILVAARKVLRARRDVIRMGRGTPAEAELAKAFDMLDKAAQVN